MSLLTRHDPFTALHQVLCRWEEVVVGLPEDDETYFGNHPLPLTEFLRGISECGEPRGRFIDVGCGAGTKLALAHYLGWTDLVGVELREDLAAVARMLVPEAEIVVADAMTWNFSGYAVVYTYRLCQDLTIQEWLAERIAATADPGTLVFYAGADMPGEPLAESIWRI